MRDLGVTTVYDLRSETEMHKYETPIPDIKGVKVVHVPVFKTEDYSPEEMAKCVLPVIPAYECSCSSIDDSNSTQAARWR